MSSLYRLIDLAKRTGDRLIVHDPANGHDTVIMGIDQYEDLLEGETLVPPQHDPEPQSEPQPQYDRGLQAAGDILNDRYADAAAYFGYGDQPAETSVVEENFHIPADHIEDYESLVSEMQSTERDFAPEEEEAPTREPAVEEPVLEDIKSLISKHVGSEAVQWEEEPLEEEEPVFYEEPV